MPDPFDKIFKESNKKTDAVLRQVRENFVTAMKSHIEYHNYIAKEATTANDLLLAEKHKILVKVYEDILSRYSG